MALSTAHGRPLNELFVGEESSGRDDQGPAIYLDTTVVSYLTARLSCNLKIAHHQRLTRVWWKRYRHHHALRVSTRMLKEAGTGNVAKAAARLDAVTGIPILPFDAQSERLAEKLGGGGRLPEKARTDAEHIAIAATSFVPLLLTWNCKHLANRMIYRQIVLACESEGFRCPEICTPEHLMRAYIHAKSTYR